MLNNLKIGTKLKSGFVIILLLLLAIGLTGYFAIRSSGKMITRAVGMEELVNQGTEIKVETLLAQLAAAKGELTRENEYEKEGDKAVDRVRTILKGMEGKLDAESKKQVDLLLIKFQAYSDADSSWYRKEEIRDQKFEELVKLANDSIGEITKLHEANEKAMRDEALQHEGGEFFSKKRVILKGDIEGCLTEMQTIRRQYYQWYCEPSDEKKTGYYQQIKQGFQDVKKSLENLAGQLTTDVGKAACQQTQKNLVGWEANLDANLVLLKCSGSSR